MDGDSTPTHSVQDQEESLRHRGCWTGIQMAGGETEADMRLRKLAEDYIGM